MQKRIKRTTVFNKTKVSRNFKCSMHKIKITLERKNNEIRESELRYSELVELSPEPVIVHQDERVVYINPTGVKVLGGVSSRDFIGQSVFSFVRPEFLELARKRVRQLTVERKATEPVEQKFTKLDGTVIDVEVKAVPITYQGRHAIQLLCKDITERKKAELSLIESEQRYKSLVENNPDGICRLDLEGNIISANPAAEIITGYPRHELLQLSYISLFSPEQNCRALNYFETTKKGTSQIFESTTIQKNGDRVEWICKNVPIDINGQIVGVFMIIRDITEQKETEELLKKSDKLSIVGQLAAGVAHEIRNPLTSLKGFTQLLKTKYLQDGGFFEIMLSELDRINFIVNEFMAVAKPKAMKFELEQPKKIVSDVVALMNAQAIMNNVQIDDAVPEELPYISCDEIQLKQVFINILQNAIEAMPNGGKINVSAQWQPNVLIIKFADHGCGIPVERIKLLGEPFYSTKEKGTGLGLMICFKIIENHNGVIKIKSKVNSGTIVEILLPASLEKRQSQ